MWSFCQGAATVVQLLEKCCRDMTQREAGDGPACSLWLKLVLKLRAVFQHRPQRDSFIWTLESFEPDPPFAWPHPAVLDFSGCSSPLTAARIFCTTNLQAEEQRDTVNRTSESRTNNTSLDTSVQCSASMRCSGQSNVLKHQWWLSTLLAQTMPLIHSTSPLQPRQLETSVWSQMRLIHYVTSTNNCSLELLSG